MLYAKWIREYNETAVIVPVREMQGVLGVYMYIHVNIQKKQKKK